MTVAFAVYLGELVVYLMYKVCRNDFLYWVRFEGTLAVVVAFVQRIFIKVIVDFSMCMHMRHPFELGGLAFSVSMIWAQAMPFIALAFDTGEVGGMTEGIGGEVRLVLSVR